MERAKSEYYGELQKEESSLISSYLNLYQSASQAKNEDWGNVHRDLEDFYKLGQQEPIPFAGQQKYQQMSRWVADRGPLNWAWQPNRRTEMEEGLHARHTELERCQKTAEAQVTQASEEEGQVLGGRKGEEAPPHHEQERGGGGEGTQ